MSDPNNLEQPWPDGTVWPPTSATTGTSELAPVPGSAFLVQRLGKLLQIPEREWTEKAVIEAVRDLLARYKHTMSKCQDAAQKYRLGLGGEPVDRLVLDELHRLKQNDKILATGGAATRSTEADQPKNHD